MGVCSPLCIQRVFKIVIHTASEGIGAGGYTNYFEWRKNAYLITILLFFDFLQENLCVGQL